MTRTFIRLPLGNAVDLIRLRTVWELSTATGDRIMCSSAGMFAIGKLSLFRLAVTAVSRASVLSKVTVALLNLGPYSLKDCGLCDKFLCKTARPGQE